MDAGVELQTVLGCRSFAGRARHGGESFAANDCAAARASSAEVRSSRAFSARSAARFAAALAA